jgi:hypothetical protein
MNAKSIPFAVAFAIAILVAACGVAPAGSERATDAASPPPHAQASLLPDGIWEVDLTADDLLAAGAPVEDAKGGVYRWAFDGTHARITVEYEDGGGIECDADASAAEGGVSLEYRDGPCGGEVDLIEWAIEADGLHLSLVETNAPVAYNKAYLEAKPWQPVDG